jgi:hypothetical protein
VDYPGEQRRVGSGGDTSLQLISILSFHCPNGQFRKILTDGTERKRGVSKKKIT